MVPHTKWYLLLAAFNLPVAACPLIGLRPYSQRYFVHHHAANDTFDQVNRRELKLGAAAMAALVYLLDQHGLEGEE